MTSSSANDMKMINKCFCICIILTLNLLVVFIFQRGSVPEKCAYHHAVPSHPPLRRQLFVPPAPHVPPSSLPASATPPDVRSVAIDVECLVNRRYIVDCKRFPGFRSEANNGGKKEPEIYVPFSFIHKYYEVQGELVEDDRFTWTHSIANIYPLNRVTSAYAPHHGFMSFARYQVEMRPRVKYICSTLGVPLSTQWRSVEYAYPTQIAQYGLSHYSRYVEGVGGGRQGGGRQGGGRQGGAQGEGAGGKRVEQGAARIAAGEDGRQIGVIRGDVQDTNDNYDDVEEEEQELATVDRAYSEEDQTYRATKETNLAISAKDNLGDSLGIYRATDERLAGVVRPARKIARKRSKRATGKDLKGNIIKKKKKNKKKQKSSKSLQRETSQYQQNLVLQDDTKLPENNFIENKLVFDKQLNTRVYEINKGPVFYKVTSSLTSLIVCSKLDQNSSIDVVVQIKTGRPAVSRHFTVRYVVSSTDSTQITKDLNPSSQIYYIPVQRGEQYTGGELRGENGVDRDGEADHGRVEYSTMARDLVIDVVKAFGEYNRVAKKQKLRKNIEVQRILSISISGQGRLANLTLKSSIDYEATMASANWFINNQDDNGGWSVPVEKSLSKKRIVLKAGWYSAMAQGQAISLLVRAYYLTKKMIYLESADRALHLFSIDVKDNGITTSLYNNVWYEEYPTQPSVYVLNGFMYSLIGLYDASQVLQLKERKKAHKLYEAGIASLEKLLPLFDTGSGSYYDLRHHTLDDVPPNLARTDYHATHVNQLYLLSHIRPQSTVFASYAKRWHAYNNGQRSPHN